jgi:spore coat polysaccharide biosynthesis predicted glycosyltransferase SpsG
MVAIGGVDRHGAGQHVVAALERRPDPPAVDVVAGASAERLADALAAADAVISGGGLTKYEAAYTGTPVAVVSQTPEEYDDTRAFVAAGFGFDLGAGAAAGGLAEGVGRFLDDAGARAVMHERTLAAFPAHSTAAAVRAFCERMSR